MTRSTETVQRENIVETRHTITGLEYDTEYEVKLFAVNKQGDSEPDVRTFKTKSGMYLYLRLITLLLVELFEIKQNKYCWVLNTGVTQLFIRLRIVKLCDNRLNIHAAALIKEKLIICQTFFTIFTFDLVVNDVDKTCH